MFYDVNFHFDVRQGGFIAAVHFFLPQSYLLFSARSRRRFSSAS
jgi:hypothetical protein